MVFRFQTTQVGTQAISVDPNAGVSAGQQFSQAIGDAIGSIDGYMEKSAALVYENELTRFDFDMKKDLLDISGQALGGVRYTELAREAYQNRKSELYERIGSNIYARQAIDEYFKTADAKNDVAFQAQQLELAHDWQLFSHEQFVDNSMQEASRINFSGSDVSFLDALGHSESSGNYSVKNSEGFVGKYQFGQARLDDFAKANGIEKITTEQFRKDPALQERAVRWHIADIDAYIEREGLDHYIGHNVGGVVITQDGMRAMAHLGGKAGMRGYLQSGGKRNYVDSNGTSLRDYAAKFGVDRNGVSNYNGPITDLKSDPFFQQRLDAGFAQIDALDISANKKAELKKQFEAGLYGSAIDKMAIDSPHMALAALRSGAYDDALSYKFTSDREARLYEQQISAQAKQQEAQFKASAIAAYGDLVAWQDNGFQGEAPRGLSDQEYFSLTPSQRGVVDNMQDVQIALQDAILNDFDPDVVKKYSPAGEGYEREQAQYDAITKARGEYRQAQRVQAEITAAQESGRPINTHIEGVNEYLDAAFAEIVNNNPDAPEVTVINEFAQQFGALPEGATDAVIRGLYSDDEATARAAVQAIEYVQGRNPDALASLSKDDVSFALGVATRARVMPVAEARKAALDARNNKIARKDRLDLIFKTSKDRDEAYNKMVIDISGGVYVSPRAQSELIALFEDALSRDPNIEAATEAVRVYAEQGLFGQTSFGNGGDAFVINPPEKAVGVWGDIEVDASWQLEQLTEEFGEYDDFQLEYVSGSDPANPRYNVLGIKEGEFPTVLTSDGLFYFDASEQIIARNDVDGAGDVIGQANTIKAEISRMKKIIGRDELDYADPLGVQDFAPLSSTEKKAGRERIKALEAKLEGLDVDSARATITRRRIELEGATFDDFSRIEDDF